MTAIRSLIVSASSWSWVTYTKVIPTSAWMRLSSIWSWRRSLRSRAPSGSSRSSTLGRFTSARASATRCCWPPDSWFGLRLLVAGQVDELERLADPAGRLVLGDAPALEPERDVVADVEMGEQGVVLEDHVDRALVGRVVGHVAAAQQDRARRSGARSRRSSAASWSCRSPTARAARRTRRRRPRARRRRPPGPRGTASRGRAAGSRGTSDGWDVIALRRLAETAGSCWRASRATQRGCVRRAGRATESTDAPRLRSHGPTPEARLWSSHDWETDLSRPRTIASTSDRPHHRQRARADELAGRVLQSGRLGRSSRAPAARSRSRTARSRRASGQPDTTFTFSVRVSDTTGDGAGLGPRPGQRIVAEPDRVGATRRGRRVQRVAQAARPGPGRTGSVRGSATRPDLRSHAGSARRRSSSNRSRRRPATADPDADADTDPETDPEADSDADADASRPRSRPPSRPRRRHRNRRHREAPTRPRRRHRSRQRDQAAARHRRRRVGETPGRRRRPGRASPPRRKPPATPGPIAEVVPEPPETPSRPAAVGGTSDGGSWVGVRCGGSGFGPRRAAGCRQRRSRSPSRAADRRGPASVLFLLLARRRRGATRRPRSSALAGAGADAGSGPDDPGDSRERAGLLWPAPGGRRRPPRTGGDVPEAAGQGHRARQGRLPAGPHQLRAGRRALRGARSSRPRRRGRDPRDRTRAFLQVRTPDDIDRLDPAATRSWARPGDVGPWRSTAGVGAAASRLGRLPRPRARSRLPGRLPVGIERRPARRGRRAAARDRTGPAGPCAPRGRSRRRRSAPRPPADAAGGRCACRGSCGTSRRGSPTTRSGPVSSCTAR